MMVKSDYDALKHLA